MPFIPDIFSTTTPIWHPLPASHYPNLAQVLSHFFSVDRIKNIHQIGALEINSSNYRVTLLDNSRFVLKRSSRLLDNHKRSLLVQRYLADSGCRVVIPTSTLTGELYLSLNDNTYFLYPYLDGDYYSGSQHQLRDTASGIGKLFSVLRDYPAFSLFPLHASLFTEVNESLISNLDVFLSASTPPHFESLSLYSDKIIDVFNFLDSLDLSSGVQLVHIDMHPHNILLQGSRVQSFLDWDSLAIAPVELALSFAMLKLCRQSISNFPNELSTDIFSLQFIESFSASYNYSFNSSCLRSFAQFEVLRRIFLILDLNFNHQVSSWNHVLPIQLGHLDEIDIIFPAHL